MLSANSATCCVTWAVLLTLPKAQFPYLKNGGNNSSHNIRSLGLSLGLQSVLSNVWHKIFFDVVSK